MHRFPLEIKFHNLCSLIFLDSLVTFTEEEKGTINEDFKHIKTNSIFYNQPLHVYSFIIQVTSEKTNNLQCDLLVSNWHFEVKLKKTKLHDFIEVSDERVEDAVDVWRVNEGEVW